MIRFISIEWRIKELIAPNMTWPAVVRGIQRYDELSARILELIFESDMENIRKKFEFNKIPW